MFDGVHVLCNFMLFMQFHVFNVLRLSNFMFFLFTMFSFVLCKFMFFCVEYHVFYQFSKAPGTYFLRESRDLPTSRKNMFFKVENRGGKGTGGLAGRQPRGAPPGMPRPEVVRGEGGAPPGMPRPEVGGAPRQACQGQKWWGCAPPGARGSGGREPPRIMGVFGGVFGVFFRIVFSVLIFNSGFLYILEMDVFRKG